MKTLSEWSAAVRARDGCCRKCGSTQALVAHHIEPKSVAPHRALDLENGETLCSNCHIEHHRAEGFGRPGRRPAAKPPPAQTSRTLELTILKAENEALRHQCAALRKELAEALAEIHRVYSEGV